MIAGRSDLELHVATTANNKGLKDAADSLDNTKESSDSLGKSFKATGKESTQLEDHIRDLGREFDDSGQAARGFGADLERTEFRLRELGREADRTGRRDFFGWLRRSDRDDVNNLRAIRTALGGIGDELTDISRVGTSAVGSGLSGLFSGAGGPIKAGLIAGVVAVAGQLAVVAGAVIEGALSGTVVGGAMAAGIASAARDSQVRSAARQFGDVVKEEFFAVGPAFIDPAVESLHILGSAVRELDLAGTFGKAAPSVTIVARGVADLATNTMPGLNKLLDRSAAFSVTFAQGLGRVGDGLSDFLTHISESEGSIAGLNAGMRILANGIVFVGRALEWLGDRFIGFMSWQSKFLAISANIADAMGQQELGGLLRYWAVEADRFVKEVGAANAATNPWVQGLRDLVSAADGSASAVKDLNREIANFYSPALTVSELTDKWEGDLDRLRESIAENGRSLDNHTEAGRANRDMLRTLVEDAMRLHDAEVAAAGGSAEATEKANKKYQEQLRYLESLAIKLGLSREEVEKLVSAYKRMPADIEREIRIKIITSAVSAAAVAGAIAAGASTKGSGQYQGRAAGGPVLAGIPYKINERGGETVTFPAPGRVHPAGLTPMMNAQRIQLELSFRPTGKPILDAIIEGLSYAVRTRAGGDVQVLFSGSRI